MYLTPGKGSTDERTVNTVVNVLLVAAKVVAVLFSSSVSLTASLVDSALDLLSTFIILGTSWAIGAQSDRHLVRTLQIPARSSC